MTRRSQLGIALYVRLSGVRMFRLSNRWTVLDEMWDPRHTNVGYKEFVGDFNLLQPWRATLGRTRVRRGGWERTELGERKGGSEQNYWKWAYQNDVVTTVNSFKALRNVNTVRALGLRPQKLEYRICETKIGFVRISDIIARPRLKQKVRMLITACKDTDINLRACRWPWQLCAVNSCYVQCVRPTI